MSSSRTSTIATTTDVPAYPPAAHTRSPAQGPITEQPSAAPAMSLAPEGNASNSTYGEAKRLRGGCIPCPDGGCCFIIPCCC
ncbi:hypothetical protein FB45DRAFT_1008065 [Roridomyces roridus]|uniref:Uncharacterized protein n=1 Tax=Roridomyces roridus TaxID=1738132 RepID=A0AAD7FF39_9AGAR|nr:hypothetical protein FB45DRAFT_1008065 [Roridomyces roridus]